jgi:hypothetical protein
MAPYEYKWWVYDGTGWSVAQNWTTARTLTWTPSTPGTRFIQVWVRSSVALGDTWEAYSQLTYDVR